MGSIFMIKRKVSTEEKITAIESYLNGDRQLHTIVEQYGIAKESLATIYFYNNSRFLKQLHCTKPTDFLCLCDIRKSHPAARQGGNT